VSLVFRGRSNASQDGGRGRDERDKPRERERSRDRDRERDRPREAGKRDRDRERDRDTRSRSPRKERERDEKRYEEKAAEKPKALIPEEDFTKERTATPPVSFKVGGAQDHDRMEVDPETQPTGKKGNVKVKKDKVEEDPDDDDELVIEDDGMAAMQAMMGFGNFGTTHQKKVEGNDISAVRKEKKTEYRQYMNRVGGFNRPLSPTRES
jgi:U4/U6.U5 tri-snRNP-associated protein 3